MDFDSSASQTSEIKFLVCIIYYYVDITDLNAKNMPSDSTNATTETEYPIT